MPRSRRRPAFRAVAVAAYAAAAAGLALRGGGPRAQETATGELVDRSALRVCADPSNLPFSNEAGEGFENKVAELLAGELGVPVEYTYYPSTVGFIRNTLGAWRCDLVMGVTSVNELVQNTNPYYTSTYALVYRADSGLDIESLDDPRLADLTIGAVARTPPVTALAQRGLLANMKPYHLMVDTRYHAPARDLVADVASGAVDVGVLWGPIAGYWAGRQDVPLEVVPLLDEPEGVPLHFRISMGLRHGEPEWKRRLNELIAAKQDEIDAILLDYGVPLLDRQGRLIGPAAGEGDGAGGDVPRAEGAPEPVSEPDG